MKRFPPANILIASRSMLRVWKGNRSVEVEANHLKEQMEQGGDRAGISTLHTPARVHTHTPRHCRASLPARREETSSNNRSCINISFSINKSIKGALFRRSSSESLRNPTMLYVLLHPASS